MHPHIPFPLPPFFWWQELFTYCSQELAKLAAKHGERLLATKHNPISMGWEDEKIFVGSCGEDKASPFFPFHPSLLAMSLSTLPNVGDASLTYLGSMLFSRNVSGTRVLDPAATKSVAGIAFKGYGSHCDSYPTPYLTAAVAIGMQRWEVDTFIHRLDATLADYKKQAARKAAAASGAAAAGEAGQPSAVASEECPAGSVPGQSDG